MTGGRPGGATRGAVVVVVALLATLVVVACGTGQPTKEPSSPAAKSVDLVNGRWGFSLRYPAGFVKVETSGEAQNDPGLLYQLFLADPAGAKRGSAALDVLGISIHRMNATARPGDLRRHRAEFESMAASLAGRPAGLRVVRRFSRATLGGREALTGEYTYRIGSAEVAMVAYLVPIGNRAYWVTGQASRATWGTAGRRIGSALATLRFTTSTSP